VSAVVASLKTMALKVSRETVRQIALGIDAYELTRARYGRKAADRNRKPRTGKVRTYRPLERAEIDNFLVDVHLVDDEGVRQGRPWLTIVIDRHTGMVLGYYLSFAAPSTASMLAALRHAILPKAAEVLAILGPGHSWLACGIMDMLAMDNGSDFKSKGGTQALAALVCEPFFCPPRAPWYKALIERLGGSVNTRFIHWLPGTTLGKVIRDVEYDPKKHATFTFDQFNRLLFKYFVTIHNHTIPRGKTLSPHNSWLRHLAQWPIRMPESLEALDLALSLIYTRTLRQTGVELFGLQFNSDELGEVWNRVSAGTVVTFRVTPLDVRTVRVCHPLTGAWLLVPCTTEFQFPMQLTYWLNLKKVAERLGLDPREKRDLVRAQQSLSDEIEAMTKKNRKKALRAGEAELWRMAKEASAGSADVPPERKALPDEIGDLMSDLELAAGTMA